MQLWESDMEMTPRCRRVLGLAAESVERFHHSQVASVHLIMGLLALGNGFAVNVLLDAGVETELVEGWVSSREILQTPGSVLEGIALAESATMVFKRASIHADNHRHSYLGTEHVLLGVLVEEDDEVRELFAALDVDLENVRRIVGRELA